jgi:hypothetical protein
MMERVYINNSSAAVATYFCGTEVEHSPANGMYTLFVVGIQPVNEIIKKAEENKVKHIYFGANQSFTPNTNDEYEEWDDMVTAILDKGYWATLDFDVSRIPQVLENSSTEHRRFIAMISVKIPYIGLLNYNTTVKLDDIGFDKTNPGVWCHRLHSLTNDEVFTTWDKYTDDKQI